jgi:hypothetical protein
MKLFFHHKRLGLFIFILSLSLFNNLVYAVTKINSISCPDKFQGTVERIDDSVAPFSSPAKLRVRFKVNEVIRGINKDSIEVVMLKDGPHYMEVGAQYEMSMNNGYICSLAKII